MIILYSNETCPRCKVLRAKLEAAGLSYTICSDEKKMEELGIEVIPYLQLEDKLLDFGEAVLYIKNLEVVK